MCSILILFEHLIIERLISRLTLVFNQPSVKLDLLAALDGVLKVIILYI